MATKEIWINLPVKDVSKSKEFFTKLGFTFNTKHGDSDDNACLLVGSNNTAVMLFVEPTFKGFIKNDITDTNKSTEVLLSFDVEKREEIDEIAEKAFNAGGTVFGKPSEIDGWMYGCGFTDLDGHRWNPLFMDLSKMPKK